MPEAFVEKEEATDLSHKRGTRQETLSGKTEEFWSEESRSPELESGTGDKTQAADICPGMNIQINQMLREARKPHRDAQSSSSRGLPEVYPYRQGRGQGKHLWPAGAKRAFSKPARGGTCVPVYMLSPRQCLMSGLLEKKPSIQGLVLGLLKEKFQGEEEIVGAWKQSTSFSTHLDVDKARPPKEKNGD